MSTDSPIDDIEEGDRLPTLEKDVTPEQLFRYSAVTWNAHRIHYDPEYARTEGHPGALVQQHFHGAVIQELIMDWLGPAGLFETLEWENVGRATPNDVLCVEAEVVDVDHEVGRVRFDAWTRTAEERTAEGRVEVRLP
jgi:hydroxyacyl-ACP dehydratase HTD2-like protein with hotdog domain